MLVGAGNSNDSNHLYDTNSVNSKEIDWILFKGAEKMLKYEEVDYNVDVVFPSDYKPIYVEFGLSDQ